MCKKNTMCQTCLFDCRELNIESNCQNYILAPTIDEYWEIINDLNTNLKKVATEYGLCFNTLMKMLGRKQEFTYRYHKMLIDTLYEKEEYMRYIDGE